MSGRTQPSYGTRAENAPHRISHDSTDVDDAELEAAGYQREMPRQFSMLSLLALAYALICTWNGFGRYANSLLLGSFNDDMPANYRQRRRGQSQTSLLRRSNIHAYPGRLVHWNSLLGYGRADICLSGSRRAVLLGIFALVS